MKQILVKIIVCIFCTVLFGKAYSQEVQTLKATKAISPEDAKAIQNILNKMDSRKVALVAEAKGGKKVVYGKPKSEVVAGTKVSDIKSFNRVSVIHSTLTDFFFRQASAADKAKFEQLKNILSKYQ